MRDLQQRQPIVAPVLSYSVELRVMALRKRVAKVRRLFRDWYQLGSAPVLEDRADAVKDVLTDLRHYCTANGIDFHKQVDGSYANYLHEQKGGE